MDEQQIALYERIQQFPLDAVDVNLPFSQRLARENGWTVDYARRVVEEYKKFVFLAIAAGHPVTPSDQVDQVWHLHLLYTQSYWQEFCPNILQMPLHHNPTKGGQQERGKFNDWYSGTLRSYEAFFQQTPPADIWSPPRVRFGRDLAFTRVNTQQNWIVPKPDLSGLSRVTEVGLWAIAGLLLMSIALWNIPAWATASASPTGAIAPTHFSASTFLMIYGWIVCTGLAGTYTACLMLRPAGKRLPLGMRLFAGVLFGLFIPGSIALIAGFTHLPGPEFLGFFVLSAIAILLSDFLLYRTAETLGEISSPSPVRRTLKGTPLARYVASSTVFLSVVGLYVLGIARIELGVSRHRPVGYLVALCLVIAIYLIWRFAQTWQNIWFRAALVLFPLLVLFLPRLAIAFFSSNNFINFLKVAGLGLFILMLWLVSIYLKSSPGGQTPRRTNHGDSSVGTTCANGDCGGGWSGGSWGGGGWGGDSGGGDSGGDSGGDGGCGGCGGGE